MARRPIGAALERPRHVLAAATTTALVILAYDLWSVWGSYPSRTGRGMLIGIALVAYLILARGDLSSLGLRLRPVQGVRYWVKATLVLAAVAAGSIAVVVGVLWATGARVPQYRLFYHPSQFLPWLVDACLWAPLLEEGLYRFVLCTPSASAWGKWPTILTSGVVFAALHVVYGNPGPDNCIAGFLLGWAYLKSGAIVVPIVLHALGNFCVFLMHVVGYYWWPM